MQNSNLSQENQARDTLGATVHGGPQGERSDLPCLYSNNSIETPEQKHKTEQVLALTGILSPYHKRSAHTLYSNVDRLISLSESVEHIGFLTLTYPDNVEDHKEAYARFRSFNTNFLSTCPELLEWLCVKERQKRGAWHYHMLIQTKHNIRHGIDFEALSRGDYSSANDNLRRLWILLRQNCKKYGLGRSELLPIKSNKEAMARYLGKYISKHISRRQLADRGVRLVNYSRNWSRNSVNFAWVTDNAKEWRRKVALFAKHSGCNELSDLSDKWGPNWAYQHIDMIYRIDELEADHQKRQELLSWIEKNVPF